MEDESLFPDEKVSERDREESKAVINLDLLGEQLKKKRKKNGIINVTANKIAVRIVAGFLAFLMILSVAATAISLIVAK